MDSYTVKVSPRASRDLDEIYTYITEHLLEPGTAEHMADQLAQAILSLEQMPERNPVRRTGIYANRGYRQLFHKKYVILYRVLKQKREVHIITVRYAPSQF